MKYLCTFCSKEFDVDFELQYCPACGKPLSSPVSSVFLSGKPPSKEEILFSLGTYQIIKSIGKGGMGEVFQAYDRSCGRYIALKRIREDLQGHLPVQNRFLKEAHITSQLTHPAIIPIYSIQEHEKLAYYTMPFVEGRTLKEIIRVTRSQEKKGESVDPIGGSIPALIRIFISVCQAIAYSHSKKVLHRDIKPENIIVGKFGEVLIIDWGLAKLIDTPEERELDESESDPIPEEHRTNLGKVVGTITYMSPERALGNPATFQTEIYSLGVILYQILTLQPPFYRKNLKEFRKNMHREVLEDPMELAPYRDVPPILSSVVKKCLSPSLEQRYKSVNELINDLENYIEGRSEWFQIASIDIKTKSDWEFQENVLIAEYIAITRGGEISDWVNLMISKASFQENIKLEFDFEAGEKGHGIGILLSLPEASEREHLNDGYCLWLSSDMSRTTKLLRSTVEVMDLPEVFLKRHEKYHVKIEKIDNNIYLYLNNTLQFSYISHQPLVGTHIGLLARDANYTISPLKVFVGSESIKVNCLAVPDAFLSHKDYARALSEYRRIGYTFPGTAEGREALFRAGVVILEEAKEEKDADKKEGLFDAALEEFSKLHGTPGAPLEYLGKALVYQTMKDYEEEIKCFELSLRRYSKHPLLYVIEEQIVYRMHETSRLNRKGAYQFVLLVAQHLPQVAAAPNIQKLFKSLQKHWELLYFIEETPELFPTEKLKNDTFAIQLAFWLAKPHVILELMSQTSTSTPQAIPLLINGFFALLELGMYQAVQDQLTVFNSSELRIIFIALSCHSHSVEGALNEYLENPDYSRKLLYYILEQALLQRKFDLIIDQSERFSEIHSLNLDAYLIEAYLWKKEWAHAEKILDKYSVELLNQETTPLHFLYGCWLAAYESKEIAYVHFQGVLETAFPRSWTLLSHNLSTTEDINRGWFSKAFLYEKRNLFKQLSLYYHCLGNETKAKDYYQKALEEYLHD